MLTKSQLKSIFIKHDFAPLKRFGENYLIDGNVKDKIIKELRVNKSDTILEIGPGFGALTIDMASSGADLFAVEKDRKAYSILKGMVKNDFPNLNLFNEDILDFDIKKNIGRKKDIKVVGNLPYYITTPIIEYLIANRKVIESALIVVQREVADRILAPSGSRDYGSISCFVQYHMAASYIHTIRRGSFYPEPKVDSSLIRLDPFDKPCVRVADEEMLFRVIRGAFNQRRKAIMNSISKIAGLIASKEELKNILEKAGIDPMSRPEDLPLGAFAAIANALYK